MPDSEIKKGFLHGFRSGVRYAIHIIFIPIVALCKGLSEMFFHFATELEKI